jgi:hypothetical protein
MIGGKFRLSEEFLLKSTWRLVNPLVQFGDAGEDTIYSMIYDPAEEAQQEVKDGIIRSDISVQIVYDVTLATQIERIVP